MKAKKRTGNLLRTVVALLITLVYMVPFYMVVNVALKPPTDTRSYWLPPMQAYWDNFATALTSGRLLMAMKNSVVITLFAVVLIVVCGSFAAYPLARRRSRMNTGIRNFFLGVMMVPPLSILVSLYSTMVSMKGVNTYWGIILVLVTFELPLSIFLYTNFVSTIPRALDEAASIDGCGPIRTFFQIIMPQLKPVTASVIILTGMHCWNDYQFSLYILQSTEMRTIPLAISSFFSQTTSNLYAATAAAVLAILPAIILFLSMQKYFIRGMVDSAVK